MDLYFIFRSGNWPLGDLLANAANKFRDKVDPLQLAKNFLKVSEYTDFPKMLVSFDHKAMEKFYQDRAKSLRAEIFKK